MWMKFGTGANIGHATDKAEQIKLNLFLQSSVLLNYRTLNSMQVRQSKFIPGVVFIYQSCLFAPTLYHLFPPHIRGIGFFESFATWLHFLALCADVVDVRVIRHRLQRRPHGQRLHQQRLACGSRGQQQRKGFARLFVFLVFQRSSRRYSLRVGAAGRGGYRVDAPSPSARQRDSLLLRRE